MKRSEDDLGSAISPPPEFQDLLPQSTPGKIPHSSSTSNNTLDVVVVALPPPRDFQDLTPSPGIGDPLLISFGFSPHTLPPYQSFHHGRGFVRKVLWDFADKVSFNILNEAMVIATVLPEAGAPAATPNSSKPRPPEANRIHEHDEAILPDQMYNHNPTAMTDKCNKSNVHSNNLESQTTTIATINYPKENDNRPSTSKNPTYSVPFKSDIYSLPKDHVETTSSSKKYCSRSIKCTGLGVAEVLSSKWKCKTKTSKHYKLANRHSIHFGENYSVEEGKNSFRASLSDSMLLEDSTKSTKSKSQELCSSPVLEQNNNKPAKPLVGKFPVKKRSKIVDVNCFPNHQNYIHHQENIGVLGTSSHDLDFEVAHSSDPGVSTGNLGKVFKNLFRRNRSKECSLKNPVEEVTTINTKVSTDIPRDKQTDSESFDHARALPLPPTPPPPEPPIPVNQPIDNEDNFLEAYPIAPESADFFQSLEKVKDCGWYWGPLSSEVAEDLLRGEPDGSFIVRDSSDARYIFSLTFKLNGLIRHVRIEHDQGNFSFGPLTRFKASTIVDFIENAVSHSRSGRYLFFLHRRPILGPMRVQLLYPYSRFRHPRSLQHMCRFVILKCVRRDLVNSLNLPKAILDYLNTPQYYFESQTH